ncbi:thiol reductant ABC exporter subunit CydC [Rhodococcus sp. NPDC058521]|uniref:thiol reductant ABC exporter subunit CydC n=1 Tax=Rhodococcus sp. NPDC058521 TaxID=3346536 RepID=UPI00364FBC9A
MHVRNDPLVRAMRLLELRPRRVVSSVAAGVATLGSALALAVLSAWLITRAWQMPPVLDLTVAVVAVRALGISRGVFRYLERLSTHDTALRGTTSARTRIYRLLADGDPAASSGLRRGDLLARTGADVDALGDVVVRAVIPMAVAAVLSVAAVGVLAVVSLPAALILAAALVVSGVVAPALSARAARLAEDESARARALFSEASVTALDCAAELRVAGHLDTATERARKAEADAVRDLDRAAPRHAFASAATPLAIGVSVIASLLIGLELYAPGTMSPMALGILVLTPLSAFEATGALSEAAIALSRARIASRRILSVLDAAETHVPEGTNAWDGSGAVRAHGLRCGWPGGKVTEEVDLDLPPGRRVAVVGSSGAGKTTLLMTLAGLLPPTSGHVTAGGTDLLALRPEDVPRGIGFFAEDAHLFETSVLENLRVVRGDVMEGEAEAALIAVGAGEWLESLPEGVHTYLEGGTRAVSGGQRRRLLLARALLSPARVLLLDEPTEHMDSAAGESMLRGLLDRAGGLLAADRTVVVVTHQLPGTTEADQVIRLESAERNNPLPTS